jgi:hypothetical protein
VDMIENPVGSQRGSVAELKQLQRG